MKTVSGDSMHSIRIKDGAPQYDTILDTARQ